MSWASKAGPGIRAKVASTLNVEANALRSEIYDRLENAAGRTGRKYKHLPNRSSAEGEPPSKQSGRLANSIAVLKEATADDLTADTGPRTQSFPDYYYAAALEFGTRTGLRPRPYLEPAADWLRKRWRGRGLKVA